VTQQLTDTQGVTITDDAIAAAPVSPTSRALDQFPDAELTERFVDAGRPTLMHSDAKRKTITAVELTLTSDTGDRPKRTATKALYGIGQLTMGI
jgi:hypothetical protein